MACIRNGNVSDESSMLSWDDILELAADLPEIENGTSYGTPALKVRGKFMARLRDEGDVLVVKCDLDEKPFLLEANPETARCSSGSGPSRRRSCASC
jgi:hypothetical protein